MATTKTAIPFQIALHATHSILTRAIVSTGLWEDGITNRITSVLRGLTGRGRTFLDIGGHSGYYTLNAASLGYSVVTIEAMVGNARLIARSVDANGWGGRIELVRRALISPAMLSAGVSTVCIDAPAGNTGNGIVDLARSTGCRSRARTTTLDGALEMAGVTVAPIAVKMDIEGFEAHAIAGASNLLSRPDRPCYIWFEYVHEAMVKAGSDPISMLDALHTAGYDVKDIDPTISRGFMKPWQNVPPAFFGEARSRRAMCQAL